MSNGKARRFTMNQMIFAALRERPASYHTIRAECVNYAVNYSEEAYRIELHKMQLDKTIGYDEEDEEYHLIKKQ